MSISAVSVVRSDVPAERLDGESEMWIGEWMKAKDNRDEMV